MSAKSRARRSAIHGPTPHFEVGLAHRATQPPDVGLLPLPALDDFSGPAEHVWDGGSFPHS